MAQDFHTTVAAVSIIMAAFVFPYGLNQILLGPVGDRYGKLRVMLGALTGYSVFNLSCAFAGNLPTLAVLRACAGASSAGLIPVCLAYIGDWVPYQQRQVTLSRFLTGVVLAQSLAGPIAGAFSDSTGWRGVFVLLAAGGAVLAVLLALRLRALPDRQGGDGFTWHRYLALVRHPYARTLLLLTVAEGILFPGFFPFVAPFLVHDFGLSYGDAGLVLACFGIGAYAYTLGANRLIAGLGEAGQVLLGGLLIVATVAVGTVSDRWPAFVLVQIAIGFGYFALHTVLQARATELLPEARSTAVSSFVFCLFLGQGLGALLFGAAIGTWGYRATFMAGAAASAVLTVALALFIFLSRQHADGGDGSLANRSRQPP